MGNDLSECSHGNCFEVAYHFFDDNYSQGNFVLVHGYVSGQGKLSGFKYVHAWVEDTDHNLVYDLTQKDSYRILPMDFYYRIGKINTSDIIKYNHQQVLSEIQKNPVYGPWSDKFNEPYYKVGNE